MATNTDETEGHVLRGAPYMLCASVLHMHHEVMVHRYHDDGIES